MNNKFTKKTELEFNTNSPASDTTLPGNIWYAFQQVMEIVEA